MTGGGAESREGDELSKRVGILTLSLDPNYGGMLQAVALYSFLERNGKQPIHLKNYDFRKLKGRIKDTIVLWTPFPIIKLTVGTKLGEKLREWSSNLYDMAWHRDFLRSYIPRNTKMLYDPAALRIAVRRHRIDAVVVGSDQVWNYGLMGSHPVETFFCGFLGDMDVRRITYAASFGHDYWDFPEFTEAARANLAKFSAVSVREASGVRICDEVFGRSDCVHVVDPTLLLPAKFYEAMTKDVAKPEEPTVLEYVLDADADKGALTREALAALDGPHAVRRLSATDGARAVPVPNWVAAFRDANVVITDSFHGTIFSIMFKKNFVSVVNPERGADRFVSLLDQVGLRNRLILKNEADKVRVLVGQPIDFGPVHERIEDLRRTSANFLLEALR